MQTCFVNRGFFTLFCIFLNIEGLMFLSGCFKFLRFIFLLLTTVLFIEHKNVFIQKWRFLECFFVIIWRIWGPQCVPEIHVPVISGYTQSLLTVMMEKRLSFSMPSLPCPFLVADFEGKSGGRQTLDEGEQLRQHLSGTYTAPGSLTDYGTWERFV